MSPVPAILEFINRELVAPDDDAPVEIDDEILTTQRIDSLGLMRLIEFIDSELSIRIPYEDILIENFRTVRAMGDYLSTGGVPE